MASKSRQKIDELIQSISLHTPNPIPLHLTILPYMILYSIWLYFWVFVYGVSEYYEAGLVALVAIAFLQIFTCLCCFWSVHFRTFASCRSVSWNIFHFFFFVFVLISCHSYVFRPNHQRRRFMQKSCRLKTMDRMNLSRSSRCGSAVRMKLNTFSHSKRSNTHGMATRSSSDR